MGAAWTIGERPVRLVLATLFSFWLTAPVLAAELVMVSTRGCSYCMAWEREVGVAYPRSAEASRAPLRHVDFRDAKLLPVGSPVRYTPTFILIDEGRERGRITGYHDAGLFWGLLGSLLADLGPVSAETGE